ncbi:hypothetical protein Ciccas_011505 [Cichlidogyrus casuarinus]|uniref:Uncharacterized protein n=1 Tax=Cichlidogyrus casuarinus TaxID=1844966 RepID=A0ABD2PU01_9PLAT
MSEELLRLQHQSTVNLTVCHRGQHRQVHKIEMAMSRSYSNDVVQRNSFTESEEVDFSRANRVADQRENHEFTDLVYSQATSPCSEYYDQIAPSHWSIMTEECSEF